ncbi:MAG: GntR family transcriptional regulator [Alkalilacustris sp.]
MDTVRDGSERPVSATALRVADLLRDRIVRGELLPGARIVERALSAELAVSRTPVREALKLLQADRLIEISLHRGAQVTRYTADEAAGLFDILGVMEGLAAERLAERLAEGPSPRCASDATPAPPATADRPADAEILDRLEQMHRRMLALYRDRDTIGYFEINSDIHDLIVAACGNPILRESRDRLLARARRGRYLAIMQPARWAQAVEEHDLLMAALRRGDGAAAAAVWRAHLIHTGAAVTALLRDKGL